MSKPRAGGGTKDEGGTERVEMIRMGRRLPKLAWALYYGLFLMSMVSFREGRKRTLVRYPAATMNSREVAAVRSSRSSRSSSPASDSDAVSTTLQVSRGGQHQEEESNMIDTNHHDVECSCYHRYANSTCCQRAVVTSHKFGYVLADSLVRPFKNEIRRTDIHPDAFPNATDDDDDDTQDYRHVAIVRNYPEAFVSGYLYHRSGRECWINHMGRKLRREKFFNWERDLWQSPYDIGKFPARDGRSICRYLANESVEDGMKVYMAVALNRWYSGLDDYYRIVDERRRKRRQQQLQDVDRTLFLCLGDYPDPASQVRLFDIMMDWLYPGGHNFTIPPGAITNSSDRNGHASPGSSLQRVQLLELVRLLDRDVFNGTVAATDALFGCSGTIK